MSYVRRQATPRRFSRSRPFTVRYWSTHDQKCGPWWDRPAAIVCEFQASARRLFLAELGHRVRIGCFETDTRSVRAVTLPLRSGRTNRRTRVEITTVDAIKLMGITLYAPGACTLYTSWKEAFPPDAWALFTLSPGPPDKFFSTKDTTILYQSSCCPVPIHRGTYRPPPERPPPLSLGSFRRRKPPTQLMYASLEDQASCHSH